MGKNDAHICVSIDNIQSEEINKTVDPLNKDIASNDAGTADSNNTAVKVVGKTMLISVSVEIIYNQRKSTKQLIHSIKI